MFKAAKLIVTHWLINKICESHLGIVKTRVKSWKAVLIGQTCPYILRRVCFSMPFVTEKGTKWVVTLTAKSKSTIGQRLLESGPQPPGGLKRYCMPCWGNQACLWTRETNGGTVQQKVKGDRVSQVIFLHLVWNSLDVRAHAFADCDHRIRHLVTFKWCRLPLFTSMLIFGSTVGYLLLTSYVFHVKIVSCIR